MDPVRPSEDRDHIGARGAPQRLAARRPHDGREAPRAEPPGPLADITRTDETSTPCFQAVEVSVARRSRLLGNANLGVGVVRGIDVVWNVDGRRVRDERPRGHLGSAVGPAEPEPR
jgi:hypothetical protein